MDVKVSLQVYGYIASVDQMARELNVVPSDVFMAGHPNPAGRPYKENSLFVDSPLPREASIEMHLEWLLGASGLNKNAMRNLDTSIKRVINCAFYKNEYTGAIDIGSATLLALGELGIDLDVAVYADHE